MQSVDTKSIVREIKINAKHETVFEYLVDPSKLRKWMMRDGTTDPRPGGAFRWQVIEDYVAAGKYLEVSPPSRVVFTFGWEGDDSETKVGSSQVEITLKPDGAGTLLTFIHSGLPNPESAKSHAHGWDHYLGRLAIAATGGDPGPDRMPSGDTA